MCVTFKEIIIKSNLYNRCFGNKMQIFAFQAQFFIVTIHNSQFLFMECPYPWKYVAFIQGFTTIIAILFLNFYIKTYRRNPKKNPEVLSNGYHANGHVVANGKSNGHISNGFSRTKDHLRQRKV